MKDQPMTLVQNEFFTVYGEAAKITASAPGRVNIIGDHTDYNDGFVLPTAIALNTSIAISKRPDRIIEATSINLPELSNTHNSSIQIHLDKPIVPDANSSWANYLRGIVQELQHDGIHIGGCNIMIAGNLPIGAGLSSSASLEIAVLRALTELFSLDLSLIDIAKIAQRAENNFCGCHCGIMDQVASIYGTNDSALLLDCRSLEMRSIPLPEQLNIVIIDSNIQRQLTTSHYNTRRRECQEAAEFFQVETLRDVTLRQLIQAEQNLDPTLYKRAKHVITENFRVLEATKALEQNNIEYLSELMGTSHQSMAIDYQVSTPDIDTLVNAVSRVTKKRGGVRMTGGGFGGCIIVMAPTELMTDIVSTVNQCASSKTGFTPRICYDNTLSRNL